MKIRFIRRLLFLFAIALLVSTSFSHVGINTRARVELNSAAAAPTSDIGAKTIKWVSFAPDGGWAILVGKNGYSTNNVPKAFNTKLKELNDNDDEIKSVGFTSDGGWVIIYGTNGYWLDGIPQKAADKLKALNDDKSTITQVSFFKADKKGDPDNWLIVFDEYGYSGVGLPKSLVSSLKEVNTDEKTIKQISFNPNGDSVLLYGKNGYYWSDGLPEDAVKTLKDANENDHEIFSVAFGEDDAWVIVTDQTVAWGNVSKDLAAKFKSLLKSDS